MNKEILIVPDVHGRDFWKVIDDYPETSIVFLGDYLSPYISHEHITNEQSIKIFKEIIKYKQDNYDRVTLLLGNHDASYIIGVNMCENRVDYKNYDIIRKLFWDNSHMFQLTKGIEINNKKFIFSHAGYTKRWIKDAKELFMTEDLDKIFSDWDYLNRMNKTHSNLLYRNLRNCSSYRGGYDNSGSPIWADVQEHINKNVNKETDWIQIFGHSWCKIPIHSISEYEWYMLDTGKNVFYIDDNGILRFLKDDKEVKLIDNTKLLS